jgi:uncharacterized membrane protein
MSLIQSEAKIEKEFHVSVYIIVYKFGLGLLEFLSGFTLWFFGQKIYQVYRSGILQELSEDPHDLLANLSQKIVPNLLTHNGFIIIYLLILGSAKIAGAVGLIYKKNWGVDLLVGLTTIMAPFQIVNLILHPNIFDLFYFIIGLVIALYLIEFRPKAWISRMLQKLTLI